MWSVSLIGKEIAIITPCLDLAGVQSHNLSVARLKSIVVKCPCGELSGGHRCHRPFNILFDFAKNCSFVLLNHKRIIITCFGTGSKWKKQWTRTSRCNTNRHKSPRSWKSCDKDFRVLQMPKKYINTGNQEILIK